MWSRVITTDPRTQEYSKQQDWPRDLQIKSIFIQQMIIGNGFCLYTIEDNSKKMHCQCHYDHCEEYKSEAYKWKINYIKKTRWIIMIRLHSLHFPSSPFSSRHPLTDRHKFINIVYLIAMPDHHLMPPKLSDTSSKSAWSVRLSARSCPWTCWDWVRSSAQTAGYPETPERRQKYPN